jgi:hypothetical protein
MNQPQSDQHDVPMLDAIAPRPLLPSGPSAATSIWAGLTFSSTSGCGWVQGLHLAAALVGITAAASDPNPSPVRVCNDLVVQIFDPTNLTWLKPPNDRPDGDR